MCRTVEAKNERRSGERLEADNKMTGCEAVLSRAWNQITGQD